jgi:hypothetical protein
MTRPRATKTAKRAATRTRTAAPKAPAIAVRAERVAPFGPLAGVVMDVPRHGAQQSHPLVGADVKRVTSIMAMGMLGHRRELEDLFDDMIDRDPRVAAVTSGRILAVTGRPFSIKPALGHDDDPEAVAIAEHCAVILSRVEPGHITEANGGGWSTVVANIASGVARGLSVSEIEWGVSPEGWHVPVRIHWRHGNRFGFDEKLRVVVDDLGARRCPLEEYGPDRFIVHSPTGGRAGYATRRGFLFGCILLSLVKRAGVRDWMKGTERWGQPLPLIELPEGASEDLRDKALELANRLATNFAGVLWGGAKLAQVPGSGGLNPAIYRELADFCNTEIAVYVLGNNLNAEIQGGSFAAAQAAAVIRQDILAADRTELDDTITRQLLARIVRYNWPGSPVPVYETELSIQQPLTLDDVREGLCTEDEYRASKGYEAKPEGAGSEYRKPLAPVPQNAPFGSPLGGADAAPPFALSTPAATTTASTPSTSRTYARSDDARASELYRRLAGSASTRSTAS